MKADPAYEAQWQDYRRRSRLGLLLFLGYVPGVALLGLPLTLLFSSGIPILVVAGAWMLALSVIGNRGLAWRCPRCGEHFFRGSWYYNSFARRCVHCGLPKWSTDPDAGK
jgi:hypothetical protein